MQDGSVVLAAELPSNFRKRGGGQLLDDIHGYLAREGDGAGVAADLYVLFAQVEVFADALLNEIDGDALFLGGDDVPENLLRGSQGDGRAGERGIGHQAGQSAFELAHVGFNRAGNVLSDLIREMEAVILRFFLENGDFGFEIGGLDIR